MSKRVLIIAAVGLLCLVAAFLLHGKEVKEQYSYDDQGEDQEPEPEPKPKRNKKPANDEPEKEEPGTAAEPGAEAGATE